MSKAPERRSRLAVNALILCQHLNQARKKLIRVWVVWATPDPITIIEFWKSSKSKHSIDCKFISPILSRSFSLLLRALAIEYDLFSRRIDCDSSETNTTPKYIAINQNLKLNGIYVETDDDGIESQPTGVSLRTKKAEIMQNDHDPFSDVGIVAKFISFTFRRTGRQAAEARMELYYRWHNCQTQDATAADEIRRIINNNNCDLAIHSSHFCPFFSLHFCEIFNEIHCAHKIWSNLIMTILRSQTIQLNVRSGDGIHLVREREERESPLNSRRKRFRILFFFWFCLFVCKQFLVP